MAESDELDHDIKMASINKKMSKSSSATSKYRIQLIERGLIESDKFGYVNFVLPFFKEFLVFRLT
jgi:hypothetical protein